MSEIKRAKRTETPPSNFSCYLCKKPQTATVHVEHEPDPQKPKVSICSECYEVSVRILILQAMSGDEKAEKYLKSMNL